MEYIFLQGDQPAVPVKQKCTARGQVRHSVKNTIFIWGRLSREKHTSRAAGGRDGMGDSWNSSKRYGLPMENPNRNIM